MAIQKTEGIILRTIPFRETSLIVTFLTKDFGKIKTLCKGVRKEGLSQYASLELFTHLEIIFYEKTKTELYLLSEWYVINFFPHLSKKLEFLVWATYLVELAEAVVQINDPNKEIFDLLLCTLAAFSEYPTPHLLRSFEIKLFSLAGFLSNLQQCLFCQSLLAEEVAFSYRLGGLICSKCLGHEPEAISITKGTLQTLRFILLNELEKSFRLKLGKKVGEELNKLLKGYISFRLEKKLKTLEFAEQIRLKVGI